jgi:hypothetical protein
MNSLALFGLMLLVGASNLLTDFLQWVMSPYGLVSVFIAFNMGFCVFTHFCPPTSIVRKLCAGIGCAVG